MSANLLTTLDHVAVQILQFAALIRNDYRNMRRNYKRSSCGEAQPIEAELIDSVITKLKKNKAAGLDTLTAEHLQYSHPALATFLAKLFNIMIINGYMLLDFGCSYTVPLPKGNQANKTSLTLENFRGISISPVLSTILEHCILDRYAKLLTTIENQFGFKKGVSCSSASYSVRSIVDTFITGCSTVNLCTIDRSKAFDKMNHHALLIKLMNR